MQHGPHPFDASRGNFLPFSTGHSLHSTSSAASIQQGSPLSIQHRRPPPFSTGRSPPSNTVGPSIQHPSALSSNTVSPSIQHRRPLHSTPLGPLIQHPSAPPSNTRRPFHPTPSASPFNTRQPLHSRPLGPPFARTPENGSTKIAEFFILPASKPQYLPFRTFPAHKAASRGTPAPRSTATRTSCPS